jgi:hypothetical protein
LRRYPGPAFTSRLSNRQRYCDEERKGRRIRRRRRRRKKKRRREGGWKNFNDSK